MDSFEDSQQILPPGTPPWRQASPPPGQPQPPTPKHTPEYYVGWDSEVQKAWRARVGADGTVGKRDYTTMLSNDTPNTPITATWPDHFSHTITE
eukprot:1792737-Alexandrium_andersonii.AAC.1